MVVIHRAPLTRHVRLGNNNGSAMFLSPFDPTENLRPGEVSCPTLAQLVSGRSGSRSPGVQDARVHILDFLILLFSASF